MVLSESAELKEAEMAFRLLFIVFLISQLQICLRFYALGIARFKALLLGPDPLCRTEAAMRKESLREEFDLCNFDFPPELFMLESSCICCDSIKDKI
jgi:hypothetical protein